MKIKLVTGYVPIPAHPRSAAEYGELGEQLSGVPVPKKAFYAHVEDTWLWQFVKAQKIIPTISQHDNPAKNTLAYHCVNHQKSAWLVQAAEEDEDADVLVWVDYGIFRLPGVNNESIHRFFQKLDDKAIYAPGCWGKPDIIESAFPCWRFCGSVIAVPRKIVNLFDASCRAIARNHFRTTGNIEWEVNTWARVEQKVPKLFHWYRADHDVSMFDNFRSELQS